MQTKTKSKTGDIRFSAMNYLARREHSRTELIKKLGLRLPDDLALLHLEVQKLSDEKLQCDRRFAENYLRHRSERGFGLVRIWSELKERGVSINDIEYALTEEALDWHTLAKTAFIKKYGERPPADIKEKAKRIRFMQYRGFTADEFQSLV